MLPNGPAAEQIGDEILLWTGRTPHLDLALADAFPADECRWDDGRQCWVIAASRYEEMQQLVREHQGCALVVA